MPILTVPNDVVGKLFKRVKDGEKIRFYHQWYNVINGRWELTFSWKSWINDDRQNYRKPKLIGCILIVKPLVVKLFKAIFRIESKFVPPSE